MRRNTIAVLENGAGKTSIQTMMIKEIGKTLKKNKGEKKLIIFLTPTVSLVHRVCPFFKFVNRHVFCLLFVCNFISVLSYL